MEASSRSAVLVFLNFQVNRSFHGLVETHEEAKLYIWACADGDSQCKTRNYWLQLKLKCNSSINLSSWQTNHRAPMCTLPALASSILPRRELEVNVGHFKWTPVTSRSDVWSVMEYNYRLLQYLVSEWEGDQNGTSGVGAWYSHVRNKCTRALDWQQQAWTGELFEATIALQQICTPVSNLP